MLSFDIAYSLYWAECLKYIFNYDFFKFIIGIVLFDFVIKLTKRLFSINI